MFCPRCGSVLERVDGELTCRLGNMGLSRSMEAELEAVFVRRSRPARALAFSFVVGGTWHCPGCGSATVETEGAIRCPDCRITLDEFVRGLVELHPHGP